MKTGNTFKSFIDVRLNNSPQWSPVMKTGNTARDMEDIGADDAPQWSPVMKTGNTGHLLAITLTPEGASMEPGHEDREYAHARHPLIRLAEPQWSPVMKTGNTPPAGTSNTNRPGPQWSPVMKTGNTSPV